MLNEFCLMSINTPLLCSKLELVNPIEEMQGRRISSVICRDNSNQYVIGKIWFA